MSVSQYPPNFDGDVVGPASATSGHLAVFSGTTGKIIADGGAVPSPGITNSAPANTVTKSDGTNLVASAITDNGTTVQISAKTSLGGGGAIGDFGADDSNTIILGVGQPNQIKINNTDNRIDVNGGSVFFFDLPTSDPGMAGRLYTVAGALFISGG